MAKSQDSSEAGQDSQALVSTLSRDIGQIVADIDALPAVDHGDENGGELDRLVALVNEYFASPDAASHTDVWFRLYERFPDDHGYGVFWSILHGLEAQPEATPGYVAALIASIRRRPTHYPILMLHRMRNEDIPAELERDLMDILSRIAADESAGEDIRNDAREILEDRVYRATGFFL